MPPIWNITDANPADAHFPHDCTDCVYLGDFIAGDNKVYDLYVHTAVVGPALTAAALNGDDILIESVIARFGSRPVEYMSGLEIAIDCAHSPGPGYPLSQALCRAIWRGYCLPDSALNRISKNFVASITIAWLDSQVTLPDKRNNATFIQSLHKPHAKKTVPPIYTVVQYPYRSPNTPPGRH